MSVRRIDLLEVGDGQPSSDKNFHIAVNGALQSRARHLLHSAMIVENRGRPREFSPIQFFALAFLTALAHRPMKLTEIYSTYCGLTTHQRKHLGLTNLTYDQVTHFLVRVDQLANHGRIDIVDLMNGVFDAHLPKQSELSIAVDSTDFETSARIRAFWSTATDPAPRTHDEEEAPVVDGVLRGHRWPIRRGDGRLQRTKDADARDGHRSAHNNRPSGAFVGYDLTLAVNTRPCGSTDLAPSYIVGANLTSAGSHHAKAALPIIDLLRSTGHTVADITADRAYNLAKPEFWTQALRERGIEPVFDLTKRQRLPKPGYSRGTVLIDGTLFTQALPKNLRNLPAHSPDMTRAEHSALAHRYDERYNLYGYKPMTATGRRIRLRGPVRADRATSPIRCPNTPFSMRGSQDRPTTNCTTPCGCNGTVTIPDTYESNVRQRHPFGTTTWLDDYYRRNAVETANSQLRNDQSLTRGYTRVFGRIKNAFLLGFTIFAHNQLCIVNHFHKQGQDVPENFPIAHRRIDHPRQAHQLAKRTTPPDG